MKTLHKLLVTSALALTQAIIPFHPASGQYLSAEASSSDAVGTIHAFPIHQVNPNYPGKARKKTATGKIVLQVTIAADGSVKDVSVEGGDPSLTPAALDAVRQWRYVPEIRDGSRLESQATVALEYDLSKVASRPGGPSPGVSTFPSEDLITELATQQVLRVGGAVKPPKTVYAPDPEYSEEARRRKFQGINILGLVLGPDGHPRDLWIVRGLGEGLDEKSIEAVKQWRFEPATKDGEPVAVFLSVETSFHLF